MKRIIINNIELPYQVNENGEVWSDRSNKFLSPLKIGGNKNSKYLSYILTFKGKKYPRYAHRLVGEYFLEIPKNYKDLQINHKDFNKHNNHFSNLEWVTPGENMKHLHNINPDDYDREEYRKEYGKKYYQENKESILESQKEYGKKYRKENIEKISNREKKYYQENKSKYKKYYQENKESILENRKEYDKNKVQIKVSVEIREELKKLLIQESIKSGNKIYMCGLIEILLKEYKNNQ